MSNPRKAKGSDAERELISLFWNSGWGAVRIAGSGSSRFPCPDVLAGNGSRRVAVECKFVNDSKKYFTKDEIKQLIQFSNLFGAEAFVGVKFSRKGWFFLDVKDLKDTGSMFVASYDLCTEKGVDFQNLTK